MNGIHGSNCNIFQQLLLIMATSSTRAMPASPTKPTQQKPAKDKAAERLIKKERVIQELVTTEVTYNTQLGLLIAHYVQPLSDYKLLSSEQHSILFPQVQIIKGLSDTFLADLNKRREDWDPKTSKLSDLFDKFTPYFRMYQGYVNNHEKALEMMRKLQDREKWNEYCQSVRSDCKGYDLASLLILPIQRLPRYRLLLAEILKNTPSEHPDVDNLSKALDKVSEISLQINSRMKEFERRESVKRIERKFNESIKILEPHRQFIRDGKIWKVCRNKDRLYHFFLFNDILIYGSSYGRGYKFHNMLPINAAFSCDLIADGHNYGNEKNGKIFTIVSEKKSFVVYSDTIEEANKWTKCIKECIAEQSEKAHSGHYKTDSHSASVWVPDSHQKSCTLCSQKFTFVNRRHHCRRCGMLVCGKCSKYKLPNSESVEQRACKKCYFQVHINEETSESKSNLTAVDEDDDEDDFEDENAALHAIAYFVDNADESFSTEDIFNKFGHGVGSYVLVPADQDSKNEYYTVTLVVYTQTGFESFNVSLFEKKGAIYFRLESKKLKKKDFNDMNGLIAYIEKKEKLIFSYAIPRSEVEIRSAQKLNEWNSPLSIQPSMSTTSVSNEVNVFYSPTSIKGLENYPKAKALFDYEAEVHGDLTLRAGDIIYILDKEEEEGWWTGMSGNRQGLFPSTYVEVIEEKPLPSIHKNEPNEGDTLIARYDYTEGGSEELGFQIGDKIILQAKDESGWWLGKLDKTGVVGWFAPDLVVPLNEKLENEDAAATNSKFSFESDASKENIQNKEEKVTTTNGKVKKAQAPKKASPNKKKKTSISRKKAPKKKAQPPPTKTKDEKIENPMKDDAEPNEVISYKDLKNKQFGDVNVDKKRLEDYLSNAEFFEIFKMSRNEFCSKPAWKRRNMKKDKGLF